MKLTLDRELKVYLLKALQSGEFDTDTEEARRLTSMIGFNVEVVNSRDELERLAVVREQFKDIPKQCGKCRFRFLAEERRKALELGIIRHGEGMLSAIPTPDQTRPSETFNFDNLENLLNDFDNEI